jgi:phage baseplate assembly protein W|tara:strand:- start:153 stop:542 length:390 start_codon:yes stop_codon:yes gene_type:complete
MPDFSLDFVTNTFTGDLSVSKDTRAINQSITNILLTRKNEKPFTPGFGVGLESMYYKMVNMNMSDFIFLTEDAKSNINRYEPRVTFKNMKILNKDTILDDGNIQLLVTYTLKSSKNDKTDNVKIVIQEN